jgi:energy-coupling factor transport system permease protein
MTATTDAPLRLPRPLHPAAWWCWALGLATAVSQTTNPLLVGLALAVVAFVVSARRGDAPWAKGFRAYLVLGLVVVGIRVGYRIVLGGSFGTHVLVRLPELPLPHAVAGIRIGGPVTLESVLAAAFDGLRLAALLICVGAANVLADPKRLLKALPSALHEVGVAVTVSLSVAPQLVESGQRVRRARRLRGEPGRRTALVRTVFVPVLTDALDRSLLLAAAMDSRGFGRAAAVEARHRALAGALVLLGLMGACVGTYGVLDASTPRVLGGPMLVVGTAAAGAGLWLSSRHVQRTRYRPDPWHGPEWAVALCGVAVATVLLATSHVDPTDLNPSLQPLVWPQLPLVPALGILAGLLPAWLAPPVRRPVRRERDDRRDRHDAGRAGDGADPTAGPLEAVAR